MDLRELLGDEGWAGVIGARIEDYVRSRYEQNGWPCTEEKIVQGALQWINDLLSSEHQEEFEDFMGDCILEFAFSSSPEERAQLIKRYAF